MDPGCLPYLCEETTPWIFVYFEYIVLDYITNHWRWEESKPFRAPSCGNNLSAPMLLFSSIFRKNSPSVTLLGTSYLLVYVTQLLCAMVLLGRGSFKLLTRRPRLKDKSIKCFDAGLFDRTFVSDCSSWCSFKEGMTPKIRSGTATVVRRSPFEAEG